MEGTDRVADVFAELAAAGVSFAAPVDVAPDWLPSGYRLVVDPEHVVMPGDCVLAHLANDWRLVASVNNGERAGCKASEIGSDIHFVATPA